MSHVARLGQPAVFVLSVLAGSDPVTTVELYDRIAEADQLDPDLAEQVAGILGFHGGSLRLTITRILDGGTLAVLDHLERLEGAGCVGRLGPVSYDGCLWWTIPAGGWS